MSMAVVEGPDLDLPTIVMVAFSNSRGCLWYETATGCFTRQPTKTNNSKEMCQFRAHLTY